MMRITIAAVLLLALPAYAQELTEQKKEAAEHAVAILEEAVAEIEHIEDPQQSLLAMRMVADGLARAGRKDQARQVFHTLLQLFLQRDSLPEHLHTRALMQAAMTFSNLAAPEEAAEAAALIRNEDYRPGALHMVAVAHARAGDMPAAFRVAASLSDSRNRDTTYRTLVQLCLYQRQFECADRAVDALSDSPIKAQMLGRVAAAKAHSGANDQAATDIARASEIAESLPDSGEPALGTGGYVGCVASGPQTPRDTALLEVAEARVGVGDFQGARESLNGIRDVEVRENALVTLVMGYAQKHDFTSAFSAAGEILRPACRSQALSWIALQQYRTGDHNAAKRTVEQIPTVGERVYALMNIAGVQWNRDREAVAPTLALAFAVAMQAPHASERLSLLLEIARRQFQAGTREQRLATLRAAQDLAGQPAPPRESRPQRNWSGMLVSLAELLAEHGDIAAAEEVARRSERAMDPTATIARGATRGGNLEGARAWAASLPTVGERILALIGIAIGILDRAGIGRTPGGSIL